MLKNSGKIKKWAGRSDTVDVRLPDIVFVVWIRLLNMLSIKVDEEEILVGKIMWGDKNWKIVYQGYYWQVQMTCS